MFQGWNWGSWLTGVFGALLGLALAIFGLGCTQPNTTELERGVNQMLSGVVVPVAQKAIAETATRTATLQGGAQGINPGYEIEFEGIWGTILRGKAVVRLVGVAGVITAHTQADSAGEPPTPEGGYGTAAYPAITEPPTRPSG